PRPSPRRSPTTRPIRSLVPPGENGTIRRMGRCGYDCACTTAGSRLSAARPVVTRPVVTRIRFMQSSSPDMRLGAGLARALASSWCEAALAAAASILAPPCLSGNRPAPYAGARQEPESTERELQARLRPAQHSEPAAVGQRDICRAHVRAAEAEIRGVAVRH